MKSLTTICIALVFCIGESPCQVSVEKNQDPAIRGDHGLRIAFYNVENLFDTSDDPTADDDDYLPGGANAWTYSKYRKKLNNIAKTILAIGGWEAPALVGLAEIENWQVLFDLSRQTPLAKSSYG